MPNPLLPTKVIEGGAPSGLYPANPSDASQGQSGSKPMPKQPGPSPWQISPATSIGALGKSGGVRDEGLPRSFLLQNWTTIRATSPITSIVQQDSGWLDLSTFADAAFWVEVGEVTTASGGTGGSGSVALSIESSPTMDEVNFKPIAPPLVLTSYASAGGAPVPQIIRAVRTPGTVPLSRFTRWRLQSNVSGTWDATFRIRGTAGSSAFFVPTMIKGCFLWLRADLGVIVDTDNTIISWADQSGYGAIANTSTLNHSVRPTFNSRPINGQPTIAFDSSQSQSFFFSPAIVLPPSWGGGSNPNDAHAFVVHRRAGTGAAGFWTLYNGATAMPDGSPGGGNIIDDCYSDTAINPPYNCGSPQYTLTSPHVYEVTSQDNGTWANRLNGIAQFSTTGNQTKANAAGAFLGNSAGPNTYYNGDWAEMILYDRILNTAERGLLIDYFNGRYGLGAV